MDKKWSELPTTANDWELFSDMAGTAAAAEALTEALKKAAATFKKAEPKTSKEAESVLGAAYCAELMPVMAKYCKFGACDTEPRAVAKEYLNALANDAGFYGYLEF